VKIMHAPQHIGEHLDENLAAVGRLRPLSVGFTELDPGKHSAMARVRRALGSYDICTADIGAHSEEVAIGVRRSRFTKVQHVEVVQLHAKVGKLGIGNDRYMTVVRFTRFGRQYAHIQTHWMAALQDRSTGNVNVNGNRRAAAMVVAAVKLEAKIRVLRDEGREVFVSGDFNYRLHAGKQFELWDFSPAAIFERLDMPYRAVGLDWMAWTPGMSLKEFTVLPKGKRPNLSDHPWLIGRFRRKKARHKK
jgi:hypothetical protein